ncbi:MAG: FmdB family zinc ribbon protein [Planctomycetota bacterium]
MPTYEYECGQCGHAFERFQSMTERPVRTCPKCGRRSVRRLIGTGGAVIFKGSGFYQTDYRSKEYTQRQKGEKEAASTPASKTEGAKTGPAEGGKKD